jgi:hypothetical protein
MGSQQLVALDVSSLSARLFDCVVTVPGFRLVVLDWLLWVGFTGMFKLQ